MAAGIAAEAAHQIGSKQVRTIGRRILGTRTDIPTAPNKPGTAKTTRTEIPTARADIPTARNKRGTAETARIEIPTAPPAETGGTTPRTNSIANSRVATGVV